MCSTVITRVTWCRGRELWARWWDRTWKNRNQLRHNKCLWWRMLPLISVHSYERIRLVVERVLERDHHALESHPLPCSLTIFDLGSWFRADVCRHLCHVQVVQGSIHLVQHEEGRRPEAARRRTTPTTRSRWPSIRNLVASKNLYSITRKLWTEELNQVNHGEGRKHHFIRHQNKPLPSNLSHWMQGLIR